MKKLKLVSILALVYILNVASMCSSDDDNSNTSADPTPVINTVNSGTWRITLYEDNGVNETNNYSNYIFTFNSNGVLTAANSTSYNGTWSVTASNSNDDSQDDLDFNIAFLAPAPNAFTDDLTDDWDVVSYTANRIQLIDVSGGNGGTDYLTFEKN
jgi:hypothetical protein